MHTETQNIILKKKHANLQTENTQLHMSIHMLTCGHIDAYAHARTELRTQAYHNTLTHAIASLLQLRYE